MASAIFFPDDETIESLPERGPTRGARDHLSLVRDDEAATRIAEASAGEYVNSHPIVQKLTAKYPQNRGLKRLTETADGMGLLPDDYPDDAQEIISTITSACLQQSGVDNDFAEIVRGFGDIANDRYLAHEISSLLLRTRPLPEGVRDERDTLEITQNSIRTMIVRMRQHKRSQDESTEDFDKSVRTYMERDQEDQEAPSQSEDSAGPVGRTAMFAAMY